VDLDLRHAALFGGLGGAVVFAIVAVTGASVGVMYLLMLSTVFLLTLVTGLMADSELREARRRARRRKALPRQR
jgi:hypothetical protein